jgi:hypothetical protein
MALAGKIDKPLDPVDVRVFRAQAVMTPPNGVAHLIQ